MAEEEQPLAEALPVEVELPRVEVSLEVVPPMLLGVEEGSRLLEAARAVAALRYEVE